MKSNHTKEATTFCNQDQNNKRKGCTLEMQHTCLQPDKKPINEQFLVKKPLGEKPMKKYMSKKIGPEEMNVSFANFQSHVTNASNLLKLCLTEESHHVLLFNKGDKDASKTNLVKSRSQQIFQACKGSSIKDVSSKYQIFGYPSSPLFLMFTIAKIQS